MKSVCLCGSFRFYDEMARLRDALETRGIACDWPTLGGRRDPGAMTADEARDAIMRHLERIDRADLVYVFDQGGYVGASVTMEIGYAYARRKPVYLLAPLPDPFLMSLVTAVVSTDDLARLVRS